MPDVHRALASLVLVVGLLSGCAAAIPASGPSPSPSPAPTAAPPTASPSPAPPTPKPTPVVTPIPGCLPACVPGAITEPGVLPAGPYRSRNFFGGQFTVTLTAFYTSREDSTGELAFEPGFTAGAKLLFWLDVYPIIDPTRTPVKGVELTADGVLSWLEHNPNLEVIKREPATVGPLAGEALEFRRASDAVNVDPDCPDFLRPCVNLLGFPQWDSNFGDGGPFHSQFFAADATWGGVKHVVYAMHWSANDGAFAAAAQPFTTIIQGAQMPLGVRQ